MPRGSPLKDLAGQRFGRLTAVSYHVKDGRGFGWVCRCDCGNIAVVRSGHLLRGQTKSCGCYQRERASQADHSAQKNPQGRMTSSRLYHYRKAQGLCPVCGKDRDDGRAVCSSCRAKIRDSAPYRKSREKAAARKKILRLCHVCGGPRDPGRVTCQTCRERQRVNCRRHQEKRNAAGGCAMCGGARDNGKKVCSLCREKQRQLLLTRTSQGLCHQCGAAGPIGTKRRLCEDCWFKGAASVHLKSRKRWLDLKAIWDRQGGRCAYTGQPLAPGIDASLDHIVPKSRGGDNASTNLQWVNKRVDAMKYNCGHEEFLGLCRLIASRFPWCSAPHHDINVSASVGEPDAGS